MSDVVYTGDVMIVGVPGGDVAALDQETRDRIEAFKADTGPEEVLRTSLNDERLVIMKVSETA